MQLIAFVVDIFFVGKFGEPEGLGGGEPALNVEESVFERTQMPKLAIDGVGRFGQTPLQTFKILLVVYVESRPVLHSAGHWAHARVRGPLGPPPRTL